MANETISEIGTYKNKIIGFLVSLLVLMGTTAVAHNWTRIEKLDLRLVSIEQSRDERGPVISRNDSDITQLKRDYTEIISRLTRIETKLDNRRGGER